MAANIHNSELVTSLLGRWAASDLCFIESINISTQSDEGFTSVAMVALFQRRESSTGSWPNDRDPKFRVTLAFDGVRDLALKMTGGGPLPLMGFDLHDISSKGWEGLNFEVEDYEDATISFRCAKARVITAVAV